jgi:hypothetical protein
LILDSSAADPDFIVASEFPCVHPIGERTRATMKTLLKVWPDNIEVFRIGKWRADHLDQQMLKTMRKIADKQSSTIEDVMNRALLDFVNQCAAEGKLKTKVIPFPTKRRRYSNSSSGSRQSDHSLPPRGSSQNGGIMPTRSIVNSNVLALLQESRALHESLCFNTEKLAALIRASKRRRRQLCQALA